MLRKLSIARDGFDTEYSYAVTAKVAWLGGSAHHRKEKAALDNSDGCRPPQPKLLRFQLLPQTLQASELYAAALIRESCV